jgi:hypothetical protein
VRAICEQRPTLADGDVCNSKAPFVTEIGVGKVIRGWDEGLCRCPSMRHRFVNSTFRRAPAVSRREGHPDGHARLRESSLASSSSMAHR